MSALKTYGVREQTVSASELDVYAEQLRITGCAVVPSGFTEKQLSHWRSALDRAAELQIARHGRDRLVAVGELDTVRLPLIEDASFLEIAINDHVLSVIRKMLGDYVQLSQQNGILNRPQASEHHQSAYHRDLPYQHFVSSRPLALNALLCLDPFEPETGSTVFLPGSHKVEAFPSDAYVREMERSTRAPVGSYIVMDSMLFHRAGMNVSSSVRRAVNNFYTLPIIKQQISLPKALGGRWSDDPFLRKFLGYETEPADSVEAFYAGRAAK